MKARFRLLMIGAAAVISLVVASSAMAAYGSPRLTVNGSARTGGGGGTTITLSQTRTDDATFRVVIFVPQGYVSSTVHPAGAPIGTVTALAQAGATSGAILPLTGRITAADPAPYKTNAQARACVAGSAAGAATAKIDGVWILRLTGSGQTLEVPLYLTTVTSGQEANFASAKLTICLTSPDVPESQGGSPRGTKLFSTSLRLNGGVFSNPVSRGEFRWTSLWTAYRPGTANPNPTSSVETQSLVRLPGQVRARARKVGGRYVVSGSVTEFRTGVRTRVRVRAAKPARVSAVVRSSARGNYAATFRLRKRGVYTFLVTVSVPNRTLGSRACRRLAGATQCINVTAPSFTSTARARVRVG